jgi:hypothetical protein
MRPWRQCRYKNSRITGPGTADGTDVNAVVSGSDEILPHQRRDVSSSGNLKRPA